MNKDREKQIEDNLFNNLIINHNYEKAPNLKIINNSLNNRYQEYQNYLLLQLQKLNNRTFDLKQAQKIYNDIFLNTSTSFEIFRLLIGDDVIRIEDENQNPVIVKLIDWENWENNYFSVSSQNFLTGDNTNKVDLMIYINGFPLIIVELKREEVNVNKAIEQLERYKKQNLSSGFFRTVQLLIGSNNTKVKVWANNNSHTKFAYLWKGNSGTNLDNFVKEFLAPEKLIDYLKNFIVLRNDIKQILPLRTYQKNAIEKVQKFVYEKLDSNNLDPKNNTNNCYIWHTTGSGKTITSFKISEIFSKSKKVDKVFFVLDRKDLTEQTVSEIEKMKKGGFDLNSYSADSSKHLYNLIKKEKFIVTTIHKLNNVLKYEELRKNKDLQNQKVIFIIDECHRTQAGLMALSVKNFFNNSVLVGFTGTPIFENSETGSTETESIFGTRIDTYSILDGIKDENVLRFKIVDYVKEQKLSKDERNSDTYIQHLVDIVKSKHGDFTFQKLYNAIFAFDKIEYLLNFYKKMKDDENIFITPIFSGSLDLDVNNNNNSYEKEQKEIIDRYNKKFEKSFTLDTDGWNNYINDVQKQFVKPNLEFKKKIDIVLVVNMLLTGFDSKPTNTLYINKNLKEHNLIQAFSRTNRIFERQKQYGNIINFSITQNDINDALKLYSDGDKEYNLKEIYGPTYEEIKDSVQDHWNKIKDIEFNTTEKLNQEDWEKMKDFVSEYRSFLEQFRNLKTFIEFNGNKIIDFSDDKLKEIKDNIKICEDLYKTESIKNKNLEEQVFINFQFDFTTSNNFIIDENYIKHLLKLEEMEPILTKTRHERDVLINDLKISKSEALQEIEKKYKNKDIDDENYKMYKSIIDNWYDEFIKNIKEKEEFFIYHKNQIKDLKSIILNKILEKHSKTLQEEIVKNYPQVDRELLKNQIQVSEKTENTWIDNTELLDDLFIKTFDDNMTKKFKLTFQEKLEERIKFKKQMFLLLMKGNEQYVK